VCSLLAIHCATVSCFLVTDRDQEAYTRLIIVVAFLLAVNQCMNEKDYDKLAEMCTPTLMTMFRLNMPPLDAKLCQLLIALHTIVSCNTAQFPAVA